MMKANPLYVSLDEPDDAGAETVARPVASGGDRLEALRKKLDEAHDKADHPKALVSGDGRLQLIVIRATFNGGDLDSGVEAGGSPPAPDRRHAGRDWPKRHHRDGR